MRAVAVPHGGLGARDAASRRVSTLPRNPGQPLDLEVVRAIRVNRSAAERRAATIPTRRTVKKQWQAAWLLKAIALMDLTTLSGDDTAGNVRRLCAKGERPAGNPVETAATGIPLPSSARTAVSTYRW